MENLRETIRDLQDRLLTLEEKAGIQPVNLDTLAARVKTQESRVGLVARARDLENLTPASLGQRLRLVEAKLGQEPADGVTLRALDLRLRELEADGAGDVPDESDVESMTESERAARGIPRRARE